ncbi:hypothetical protein P691DRAFT_810366 [Macrolepiota fuliginosa MF-IS2]|uniref:GLTSCR protein conserved domain-containing protein n=1 Tax=Macrolepiota fuliginosa MF-IS2 TaxID=1400762 RepID=A0A9P5XFF0_9AGAR|nr:hypothetical protein P691DRAFT_810366 [Macrolepiota fuliginosa MF-IS2]
MSKTFGPSFNVHTFSTVPYSPQDTSYTPGLQNTQFSWSIAGPSSTLTQAAGPITPPASNGAPQPPPLVLPLKEPLKVKKRTEEELGLIHKTSERFSARLAQDHDVMLQPDVDTPFVDHTDTVRRLLPYHIYQQPREDLELLKGRKGKQKATNADLEDNEETRFALECYKRYHKLCGRFRKAKIRTASRLAPDDQAYVLAQAVLEADRVDASLLSNELKVARGELERLEREKRAAAAAATATTARIQYTATPTISTVQTQYYRPYPYAYTQAYGTPIPPPTTSTFQVSPPPPAINYNRTNTAIPVQLPVASLPALHALGIHPVPANSVTEGQPPPPAVLRGSTANGTMLTLEINVSLLQSAQMSGLAMVLNSLMSRTSGTSTTGAGPGSPNTPAGGTLGTPSTGNQHALSGSPGGAPPSTATSSLPSNNPHAN